MIDKIEDWLERNIEPTADRIFNWILEKPRYAGAFYLAWILIGVIIGLVCISYVLVFIGHVTFPYIKYFIFPSIVFGLFYWMAYASLKDFEEFRKNGE